MTASEVLWKVLVAGIILVCGGTFGSWAQAASGTALEHAGVDPMVRRTVLRLVRPTVLLISVVAALEYLDVDLTTVAAMTGAATLAFGLALQHSLSNIASGAVLMTLRPFREGEIIECGGEQGVVLEHGTFAIVLERADGTLVTVPNHVAATQVIRNHSRRGARRLQLSLSVPQSTDISALRARMLPVIMDVPNLLPSPPPDLGAVEIEEGKVKIAITVWVRPDDLDAARAALAEALLVEMRDVKRAAS